jgi:UDP-GlcNAc:undecaprenyl-phosphate GlcNAc-1-phosphate transferase
MWMFALACVAPAFLISFTVTALMRRWAPRWGFVDRPAARKVHAVPTPLGGGIGIVCGFIATIALVHVTVYLLSRRPAPPSWLPPEIAPHLPGVLSRVGQIWALIAAGVLLAAVGFLDDYRGLSWSSRLAVHTGLAAALVFGGIRATVFISQPWIGMLLTALWIVVLINSFNFLDNMDALSAGTGLIASLMFAAIMMLLTPQPRWFVGGCLLALAGSLVGFLYHNRPPAKIFMGDAGSTFIGLMLASLTILGTFYDFRLNQPHVMLAPLCVLALPLYDITSVILIRLSEGRSPFQPDKKHFSHRLVELGLTKPQAVLTVHLVTLTTGIGGLLLYRVDGWSGALLVVGLILCLLAIVAILETAGRAHRSADGNSSTASSIPESK